MHATIRTTLYLACVMACAVPASTSAQEIIDGTGDDIDPTAIETLFEITRDTLRDGYSAKFSRLFEKQVFVCGFVNAKNGFGAYAGNTPFYVDLEDRRMSLLPDQSEATFQLVERTIGMIGCPTTIR